MLTNQKIGNFSNPLTIRAHHLLCIQGFQGHGYSIEFEKHMWELIDKLNYNSPYLRVVSECDDICGKCPHNKKGICKDNQMVNNKIIEMDKAVINTTKLYDGLVGKSNVIFELVNSAFKNIDLLQKICGQCSWKDKCLYYQRRMPK